MQKKKDAIILGIIASVAIGYIVNKWIKKKTNSASLKAQGIIYFKEGKYKEAIGVLLQIKNPDLEVLKLLVESNEKLGKYTDALININKCIGIVQTKTEFTKRHEIHKLLGMNFESFKDLFILSVIEKDGNYKDVASNSLKKLSAMHTKSHKIVGWASDINFSDFFESLFFLKDLQDPAVVFINSKEYKKCFDFVKESNSECHRFLLASLYFVNGNILECISVLNNIKDYKYSKILSKLINCKKLNSKQIDELKRNVDRRRSYCHFLYI